MHYNFVDNSPKNIPGIEYVRLKDFLGRNFVDRMLVTLVTLSVIAKSLGIKLLLRSR